MKVPKTITSIKEASMSTGISRSSINSVCSENIKQYTAGGFTWKYKYIMI